MLTDATYEVTVRRKSEYDGLEVTGVYVVEVTRIVGEKGCLTLRRGFPTRRGAERFARSERRITRWFGDYDKSHSVLRLTHGGSRAD